MDGDSVSHGHPGMIKLGDIAAALSVVHPRHGGTTMHVLAWKAPPALVATIMRMVTARDGGKAVIGTLLGMRDDDGNTPLHLCAGNLDHRSEAEGREGEKKEEGGGGEAWGRHCLCLAVLKEMAKFAPTMAWAAQNSVGDTPLHMLVSSPLCTFDLRASPHIPMSLSLSSSTTSSLWGIGTRLAMEAMFLVLSLPDAMEACAALGRCGAMPLHAAIACVCVVKALLRAYPAMAQVKDERGMLPPWSTSLFECNDWQGGSGGVDVGGWCGKNMGWGRRVLWDGNGGEGRVRGGVGNATVWGQGDIIYAK